jgi:ribosomal protein S18 acetylase RimI-like enzyme
VISCQKEVVKESDYLITVSWAEHHTDIEKVSLGVFSTTTSAIALYKKMGFVEGGRKIIEFRINEYWDDILM